MIKICSQSLILSLNFFFEHSLKKGKFPKIWKKANVVPVHKKEDKMLVKNYRPISLLPIFGKMFERVIYNSLFNYFQSNRLFAPSQSGFLPGDLCIAQLLSIIHEIQTAFEDVRGVFLDISKTFNKVWHDGIIFKLKSNGAEGELFSLLKKLSWKSRTKSYFKWSNIWVEKNNVWSSTRISTRTTLVFNIHKWSSWWNKLIVQNICRWYIPLFKGLWHT